MRDPKNHHHPSEALQQGTIKEYHSVLKYFFLRKVIPQQKGFSLIIGLERCTGVLRFVLYSRVRIRMSGSNR